MTNLRPFTQKLLDKHLSTGEWDICSTYGESGYTSPEKGIIFANWNNYSQRIHRSAISLGWPKHLQEKIEDFFTCDPC